mmetsp:Transcript_724/g.1327  ORF Transcript_724/g.1327 Transcript_724/m.1327 type:complete len:80 (+) Transcript_724:2357-2596(+)
MTGTLPTELGNLSLLTHFSLRNAQLEGTIPSELGNFGNVKTILLGNNLLVNTIPTEFGNLGSLTKLEIRECNHNNGYGL